MHLFFRYKVQILLKAQYPIDIVLVSLIFSISAPSNEEPKRDAFIKPSSIDIMITHPTNRMM